MKKIIYFPIIFILILILVIYFSNIIKNNSKQTANILPTFTLEKIILYTGLKTDNSSNPSNTSWNLNVSQYTDIALYISNNSSNLDSTNTVKSLYLDNFKTIKTPQENNISFYYQNPNLFATSSIEIDNKISGHLNLNILNFDNSSNSDYYSIPTFFNDCSNPITIQYLNENILSNFQLPITDTIGFEGDLLKKANINLNELDASISFDINLINNENQFFKYTVNINIPLTSDSKTLFTENILKTIELNENFELQNQ